MNQDHWIVLELNSKADGEDPDLIKRSITYCIKNANIFIPATITQQGDDRVVHYLVDGYAFVRHDHDDTVYSRLENTRYIQSVVKKVNHTENGKPKRELAYITTKEVERMKGQIYVETDQGIGIGDTVMITSGAYKHIQATVIEDLPETDQVQVRVVLRSKDSIVGLPRSFLRLVERAPRHPVQDKFDLLKRWFNEYVEALRAYKTSLSLAYLTSISKKFKKFRQLSLDANKYESLGGGLKVPRIPKITPVLEQYLRLLHIEYLIEALYQAKKPTQPNPKLKSKLLKALRKACLPDTEPVIELTMDYSGRRIDGTIVSNRFSKMKGASKRLDYIWEFISDGMTGKEATKVGLFFIHTKKEFKELQELNCK